MLIDPNSPANAEHLEATQTETNRKRVELFAKQPPEIQENQKIIEECVRKLEERNLPFFLFVNPSGYNFDFSATEPTPNGFWQYNKLTSTFEPYTKQCNELIIQAKEALVIPLLSALSFAAFLRKVVIYGEDNEAQAVGVNGQAYRIPKKENE